MGELTMVPIMAVNSALNRRHFSCGKPELDRWLKEQATQSERRDNTRTFVAIDPAEGHVIGYYATTTYRLDLDEAAAAFGEAKRRYPVPAVLLARLAVDESWAGRGVGRQLLIHALQGMVDASRNVGFEVVVVHAIDSDAVTFYARYGFTRFEEHPLHLFMPTKHLVATFETHG